MAKLIESSGDTGGVGAQGTTASAESEQDGGAAESVALRQENERLQSKLARMREALDAMDDERPSELLDAVKTLYEDVNDIASAWKNDLRLACDYFEEIQEGFVDSEQRDSTYGALRELLESLTSASVDVKDRLKAFRGLVED